MTVTIHQLIAAIVPDVYCSPTVRKEVKALVSQGLKSKAALTYTRAAELTQPVPPHAALGDVPSNHNPVSLEVLKRAPEQRRFLRDAMGESLEAFYFQALDAVVGDDRWQVAKLIDNFEPSPVTAAHPDFLKRIRESREQADTLIESSRALLHSILRGMDRLRVQEETLGYYHDLKANDAGRRGIASSFLKQHWLETVEKRKGNMSLLRLSRQFPHRELLRQFMEDALDRPGGQREGMDWLDQTIVQRQEAFQRWLDRSEHELTQQLLLERTQLRQDLNRLKLHARWLKPLLDQGDASPGEQDSGGALVSGFNTMVFRLLLLAQGPSSIEERIQQGELPRSFAHLHFRQFRPVLVLEMEFRGTKNRLPGIRGKVEVRITGYGLSEEEIRILRREVERQEIGETILAIDSAAHDTIAGLLELLGESGGSNAPPRSSDQGDLNPFRALVSLFVRFWRRVRGIPTNSATRPDSFPEKVMRAAAILDATEACRALFKRLQDVASPA